MSRAAKLLERMRANPRDWRIEDVETVCAAFGVELEPPRGGGSHWKVRDLLGAGTLIIPAHKPINPVYIRKLVALLEHRT
jgi:hypothetical protein